MNKLLVLLKWFIITIPLGLFGLVTAPIGYPLWVLTNWRIFWIYNDDGRFNTDGTLYPDYEIYLIEKSGVPVETFWLGFKWCAIRNRIWNLRVWIESLQKGDGSGITEQALIISDMYCGGKNVIDGGKYAIECGLKYEVDAGKDPWQGWVGDIIDFNYSIIGEGYMWFKQDGILSFRYSYCKKIKFLPTWITIKINCLKSDTVFAFKLQKDTK